MVLNYPFNEMIAKDYSSFGGIRKYDAETINLIPYILCFTMLFSLI